MSKHGYELVDLKGRLTAHHIGSSSSKPRSGSWIGILRKLTGKQNLVCARSRCTKIATLGAHIRGTELEEWKKAIRNYGHILSFGYINKGGTFVVPCCDGCHKKYAESFIIKKTPAIIDRNSPLDNDGFLR